MFAIVLADGTLVEVVMLEKSYVPNIVEWRFSKEHEDSNHDRTYWDESSDGVDRPGWEDLLPFEIDVVNGKRVPDKPPKPRETNPSSYLEL